MDMKPVRIVGELFWSKWMKEFNTKFNDTNTKYECTIGNLTDKSVEALQSIGVNVKEKDTMGKYIVAKSKFVFEPVDEEGNAIDIDAIGNGTKISALMTSYEHKMSSKYGKAPSVRKLIVVELKTYEPAEEEELSDVL